ncbi:hypothetical protein FHW13_001879 [Dokdonella fugitiva]|nr:hypothetical protein [Dokdonella fugitiva]
MAEGDPMRTLHARLFVTAVVYALIVVAGVLGAHV